MKLNLKKITALLLSAGIVAAFTGCQTSDFTDQVTNIVQQEDENVLSVKNAESSDYPGQTWGEAFESFFAYPTWKYFKGTFEGSDENEDGIPDYTEDNIDVVEFTGYCTYMDQEVKAEIQFVLDKENGTFKAEYLAFNDVPQTKFMLAAIIQKAFES